MANYKKLETGKIGLIQEQPDGRILQIGLTPMQSNRLQYFCFSISQQHPLVQMGKDYELALVSDFFRFAKFMKDFDFCDNIETGDVYEKDGVRYTESEIFELFKKV